MNVIFSDMSGKKFSVTVETFKILEPDCEINWVYFGEPTPGAANVTPGYSGVLEKPYINPQGGPFSSPSTIMIATDIPGAVVRYTLDGSFPGGASLLYTGP